MTKTINCPVCKPKEIDKHLHFQCPTDGILHPDSILFLCNRCEPDQVRKIKGLFLCPNCLTGPEPFECGICMSRKVILLDEVVFT